MDKYRRQEQILNRAGFEVISEEGATQILSEEGRIEILDTVLTLTEAEEVYASQVENLNAFQTVSPSQTLTSGNGKSKIAIL